MQACKKVFNLRCGSWFTMLKILWWRQLQIIVTAEFTLSMVARLVWQMFYVCELMLIICWFCLVTHVGFLLWAHCAHESPPTLCVYWVNYEDLELTKCTHFDLIKCTNVDLKVSTIHQLWPSWIHYSPNEPTMRSQCTEFNKPLCADLIVVHQVQVKSHSPGWH